MTLVRLRANPRKIRVSIRRDGGLWIIRVRETATSREVVWRGLSPTLATFAALDSARTAGLDGIDMGMGWTYEHPQCA